MLMGESFEANPNASVVLYGLVPDNITWTPKTDGAANFRLDNATSFSGLRSQRIELVTGSYATLVNRGMGNEGLVLVGGRDYTGYFFARAEHTTTVLVELSDSTTPGAAAAAPASETAAAAVA